MNKFYIFLLIILMFSFSCDTTSPEELDKNAILDIFDSIQSNFNFDDIEGIMQHYHQFFNHIGNDYNWEMFIWEQRIADYDELLFENIDITLNGDFALVSFQFNLDDTITNEPSDENGDISYFYYDYGDWKICGDNFLILP